MSNLTSSPTAAKVSVLSRARKVTSPTIRALVPLALTTSLHAVMSLDYSAGGTYSNSGFFTGVLDDGVADGQILGTGFKLFGQMNGTDSMFWAYDSGNERTEPVYDLTGVSIVWGGTLSGATTWDDTLSAPFEFSTFFEQTLAGEFDYTSVQGALSIGYSTEPFTPEQWQSGPSSSASNSDSFYFSYDSPGTFPETGTLSVYLEETDASTDLYWFVQLEMHLDHEFISTRWWDPDSPNAYATLNGDAFSLTVPQNSIDVEFIAAIPEPNFAFALGSLACLWLLGGHRRRG